MSAKRIVIIEDEDEPSSYDTPPTRGEEFFDDIKLAVVVALIYPIAVFGLGIVINVIWYVFDPASGFAHHYRNVSWGVSFLLFSAIFSVHWLIKVSPFGDSDWFLMSAPFAYPIILLLFPFF